MKQWERDVCQKFWETQKPVDAAVIERGGGDEGGESDWPIWMRPLVDQFGSQAVWAASEAVHGCPPTWCRGAGEAFAVEKFLKSQREASV